MIQNSVKSWGLKFQQVSIGLGDGLVPKRHQAIA